jgi:hypothetical protein
MVQDSMQNLQNTQMIQNFKDYIKTAWGTDYKDTDKFTKEGDIYVVDVKDVGKFKYKYNGTTFTFIK